MKRKKYVDIQNWTWRIIIILFIIASLLSFLLYTYNIEIVSKIYLYILLISVSSALVFLVALELLKLKITALLFLMKYKKKPRIFEFGFFFFSFLATFFTIFAAGLYNNPEKFLNYLQKTWYFMSFYGIAFACGWYHYILRIDY
jgi:hypothetical protein